MNAQAVPWRRAVAIVAVSASALTAVVAVVSSDGLPAIDASATRATRWFVHRATGRVVLADGYSGQALVRLDAAADGSPLAVAEGAGGAYLLDGSSGEARLIDSAELRLGPGLAVAPLAEPNAVAGVGRTGLVVVAPTTSEAALLSLSGESIPFDVDASAQAGVAPDGAVWSTDGRRLLRTTSTEVEEVTLDVSDPVLALIGSAAFVLDRDGARARFHDGDWVDLPQDVQTSELVVQVQGPAADCAWLGADDDLWCIGRDGVDEHVTIDGLDIDGADRLVIAGDAAALIRQAPPAIVRIDWRDRRIFDDVVATVPASAELAVAANVDLVWVDDSAGDLVWSINPWGINAIRKNDANTPLLGESGEVIDDGSSSGSPGGGVVEPGDDPATTEREPDDNGIDDPPVAIDDPVTSRSGKAVSVVVTANDYDPDGEAIAVVDVGTPAHGTVDIASASTVVYQPEPGHVGLDRFEYTIVDGNGTEATASVILELLPVDALNQAPVARNDVAETGGDVGVVIDVLLNDVDPERDALRVASFTPPDIGGVVTETIGPSGLPALRYQPPRGASGRATFAYRPVDSFEATGEPATVTVEIAQPQDENRPPIVQPDAVRLRRNTPTAVSVLANDRDPDGDPLQLAVMTPLPPGLEAVVDGSTLRVTARAGAPELVPFTYLVDDLHGNVVPGTVLVVTVADVEPNRPPLVTADTATAVVGRVQAIDVLSNDSDPDGDPMQLSVVSPLPPGLEAVVDGDTLRVTARAGAPELVPFTYLVDDLHGNVVPGTVLVVTVAAIEPNRAPLVTADTATAVVGRVQAIDVLS
ncbi:MAG TPA: Ig-like domain-containing protein, partial [Ilumatobacteraceae bacterium]|nr:Ig-like domain-containing protein [Ilumatobacteraceae bacterium]